MRRSVLLVAVVTLAIGSTALFFVGRASSNTPLTEIVSRRRIVPAGTPDPFTVTAPCPRGRVASGGGYSKGNSPDVDIAQTDPDFSVPNPNGSSHNAIAWSTTFVNRSADGAPVTVWAVCIRP